METALDHIKAMATRGVDDADIDAFIEAQRNLSRDEKDALWLAWASSESDPHDTWRPPSMRRSSRRSLLGPH